MEECLEQEALGLEVRELEDLELEQAMYLEVSGFYLFSSVSLHDTQ